MTELMMQDLDTLLHLTSTKTGDSLSLTEGALQSTSVPAIGQQMKTRLVKWNGILQLMLNGNKNCSYLKHKSCLVGDSLVLSILFSSLTVTVCEESHPNSESRDPFEVLLKHVMDSSFSVAHCFFAVYSCMDCKARDWTLL